MCPALFLFDTDSQMRNSPNITENTEVIVYGNRNVNGNQFDICPATGISIGTQFLIDIEHEMSKRNNSRAMCNMTNNNNNNNNNNDTNNNKSKQKSNGSRGMSNLFSFLCRC